MLKSFAMFNDLDPVVPPKDPPQDAPKTFTQDQINTMLATEKRKYQAQMDTLTKTVNEAKAKGESVATLETELENVRASLRTKEEQAEHERVKLIKEHNEKYQNTENEANKWKKQYTDSTIERSLLDAALENKAHTPSQIVTLLRNNTELSDEIGADGKKTGRMVPTVTLDVPDKDGKLVTVKLAPKEAIKRLAEQESNANLFISKQTGGIGGNQHKPGSPADLREIAKDPKKFRELRKAGKLPYQQKA